MNNHRISLLVSQALPAILAYSCACLLIVVVTASAAPAAFAQAVDYNTLEVYGGFSAGRFKTNLDKATFTSSSGSQTFTSLCSAATGDMIGPVFQKFFCERRSFNGFDASVTYNVSKYIGIQGNVTGHSKSETFVDKFTPPGVTQTVTNKERIYNFLGGVQVKNNSQSARFKPFAHLLAGVARYTNRQSQTLDLFPAFNFTIDDRVTSPALKLGGGLDIRAGKRLDIRVFEFDYNPIFTRDRRATSIAGPFSNVSLTGRTSHNFTIGFGVVIH